MLPRQLTLAFSITRYGADILRERLFGARYVRATQVPSCAEAITPAWLTDAICRGTPGAAVIAVRCTGGSDGSTSRRALEVEYNAAGRAAGLPRYLFAKSTPALRSRLTLGPSGKLDAETGFYRDVRPLLDIEATRALYVGHHRASARAMMLFEDLVKGHGCTFCDPATYVDRAMAEDMVSLLARYHGRMWESPLLAGVPTTLQYQQRINRAMAFEERSRIGRERAASVLPQALRELDYGALWRAHMRSLAINAQAPLTLTHWDMHIGNWYRTRDGRMGLSDWGMLRGQWAADYTYALVSALTVENRRAWEQDLLRLYLDRLAEAGGKPPAFKVARLAVRQQAFHPLFYWLVTIGAGPLQQAMQPDAISLMNLERMGQACADFDAMRALEAG